MPRKQSPLFEEDTPVATEDPGSGKCAHLACACMAAAGQTYCSEYCAAADEAQEPENERSCACGHPECDAG